MTTRDEAHGKRCASVRFPVLASTPVSKARKAKARPIPKLGRHSSGQARVTLNGKVHYCGRWGTAEASGSSRRWGSGGLHRSLERLHPSPASARRRRRVRTG